jgi:hypothetical protein
MRQGKSVTCQIQLLCLSNPPGTCTVHVPSYLGSQVPEDRVPTNECAVAKVSRTARRATTAIVKRSRIAMTDLLRTAITCIRTSSFVCLVTALFLHGTLLQSAVHWCLHWIRHDRYSMTERNKVRSPAGYMYRSLFFFLQRVEFRQPGWSSRLAVKGTR